MTRQSEEEEVGVYCVAITTMYKSGGDGGHSTDHHLVAVEDAATLVSPPYQEADESVLVAGRVQGGSHLDVGIVFGVEEEESRAVQLLKQRTLGVFSELVVGFFVGFILDEDMTLKRRWS